MAPVKFSRLQLVLPLRRTRFDRELNLLLGAAALQAELGCVHLDLFRVLGRAFDFSRETYSQIVKNTRPTQPLRRATMFWLFLSDVPTWRHSIRFTDSFFDRPLHALST